MGSNDSLCILHIGIDDFDSQKYGCTTHAATYLMYRISILNQVRFIDYPNLVRLNPSIPWKTRGNGAVSIRISVECDKVQSIVDHCQRILMEYQENIGKLDNISPDYETEPGLVVVANHIPPIMYGIYMKALTDVLLPSIVVEKLQRYENIYLADMFKNRGIVGASAAIGWFLAEDDYTYELLTYRSKRFYGRERCVDDDSVKRFDELSRCITFNNVDDESGRVLVKSHGMDPVLYGVRGESPEAVRMALNVIKTCEPITAWTIFRSNQATDAHAIYRSVDELRMYTSAKLHVVIASKPEVIQGGAIIVRAFDSTGAIDLAFFRPSTLTNIASKLRIGDEVLVHGHVKPWGKKMVFHVEKIQVIGIAHECICKAPRCPVCKNRMEKSGWGKGYRCRKCGTRAVNPELDCEPVIRSIEHKMYIPPTRMQKHLIKPLSRYGREKVWRQSPMDIRYPDISQIIEPLWFL